jgi:hypothetical protein
VKSHALARGVSVKLIVCLERSFTQGLKSHLDPCCGWRHFHENLWMRQLPTMPVTSPRMSDDLSVFLQSEVIQR